MKLQLIGKISNRTENEPGQHSQARFSVQTVPPTDADPQKVEVILSTLDISVLDAMKPGATVIVDVKIE